MLSSHTIKRLGLLGLLAVSLTACSAAAPEAQPIQKPQKLTLDFSASPAPVRAGQEATLQVQVKKGAEWVDDAEVELEIWREGQESHTTDKADRTEAGTYAVRKTFAEPGAYHAILHTTTSELHQMPTVDFSVEPE